MEKEGLLEVRRVAPGSAEDTPARRVEERRALQMQVLNILRTQAADLHLQVGKKAGMELEEGKQGGREATGRSGSVAAPITSTRATHTHIRRAHAR